MQQGFRVRRLAAAAVAAGLVLTVAACTSDSSATTSTSPAASTPTAGSSTSVATSAASGSAAAGGGSSATDGIRVPDAFTAVTVRPLSSPTFPFKGSDGKYHVAYDLELTNGHHVPATIEKIDVVDASSQSTVIFSISGTGLVDPSCKYGDCARLRTLPSKAAATAEIPTQESRVVFVDFTLDTADQAPKAVLHRLYAQAAANPPAKSPEAVDYLAAPFDISADGPRVIGPPVKGPRWVAVNGCCLPGFAHRTSMATLNGLLVNSQRFAIDWKQLNEAGHFFEGDPSLNESYVDYGADIIAVADGTITSTLDDLEPNTPGVLPSNDPVLGPLLTTETVDGNNIVQDIGGGDFAFYAHLLKGSLLVKPGDTVKKGQVIAKLGNTGNSDASHMHFHLMNGPSVLGSDGVPYELDTFDYVGQVPVEQFMAMGDYMEGNFLPAQPTTAEPRTDELPLALAIVDFPG